jgi:hypothetical protein
MESTRDQARNEREEQVRQDREEARVYEQHDNPRD